MLSEEQIQTIKNIPLKELLYFKYKIVGFMTTMSGNYAEHDDGGYIRNINYKKGDIVEEWILKEKDCPSGVGQYPSHLRIDVNGDTIFNIEKWEKNVREAENNHKLMMQNILKSKEIFHREYNPISTINLSKIPSNWDIKEFTKYIKLMHLDKEIIINISFLERLKLKLIQTFIKIKNYV